MVAAPVTAQIGAQAHKEDTAMRWESPDRHQVARGTDATWMAFLDNGDEYARVKRGVGSLSDRFRAQFTDGRIVYRASMKRALTYVEFAASVTESDLGLKS